MHKAQETLRKREDENRKIEIKKRQSDYRQELLEQMREADQKKRMETMGDVEDLKGRLEREANWIKQENKVNAEKVKISKKIKDDSIKLDLN
eukprot:CAMPEP_0116871696 /NCGR_PEP_ID=MMETSP0463-20121206/2174_1 /TAXON_ID=181622 /ORGANISM="Strombidinopsis sp, Strain SopsisLIS2011" /LENGTH=91 /DNA_ID=CAMNT_0004510631 /DNA_START=501 /DNA_END=776 /DNA_ORIENTATION=+